VERVVIAPMLSLLQLMPGESGTVAALSAFAASHPGVRIVTPHYRDEPWRAEVREGRVPGESSHTAAFLAARQPDELLRKLEKMFASGDPEDDPG
jgi:hypothetical protein